MNEELANISQNMSGFFADIKDRSKKIYKEKTSKDRIKVREGSKGKLFKYVQRVDALQWLNEHYPGWSFKVIPESFKEYAGFMTCIGELTIYEVEGLKRTIQCTGTMAIKFERETKLPVMLEYYKSAETDALKRCCASLGAFADIYTDYEESLETVQNEEDFVWFLEVFFPILVSQNKANLTKVFNAVNQFYYGNVNKKQIIEAYRKKGIEL